MAVPKAAMYEDRSAVARQDDIGRAGQVHAVQTEAQAESVKHLPYPNLGDGILSWYGPHDLAADRIDLHLIRGGGREVIDGSKYVP